MFHHGVQKVLLELYAFEVAFFFKYPVEENIFKISYN
jgi:hypothetical protein